MLMEARQQQILELLNRRKSVTVKELSQVLFVSPATVRRDLSVMEKMGMIKRSHGGAVLFETNNNETSSWVREQENIHKKKKIAKLALDFFRPDCSVFLDSSSSAGAVIPLLKSLPCTVITNGLKNALLLSQQCPAKIYITGGTVNSQSSSVVGSDTIQKLEQLNTDLAMVSCGGLTVNNGVMDASFEQAVLKRAMLSHAKVRVLLCDSSKFGISLLCRTCGFDQVDYILTDCDPGEDFLLAAARGGCEVLWNNP
jgi:DeoR/GlpR family transcriptional regulator of sugar metabolism